MRWCFNPVTHPCCVLTEVASFVLYTIGVPDPLEKLHLLYYVLPFLLGKAATSKPWFSSQIMCNLIIANLKSGAVSRWKWKWAHRSDLVVRLKDFKSELQWYPTLTVWSSSSWKNLDEAQKQTVFVNGCHVRIFKVWQEEGLKISAFIIYCLH